MLTNGSKEPLKLVILQLPLRGEAMRAVFLSLFLSIASVAAAQSQPPTPSEPEQRVRSVIIGVHPVGEAQSVSQGSKSYEHHHTDWYLVIPTILLMVFTFGLFVYTAKLAKSTNSLATEAKNTAERQLRAYVTLDTIRFTSHLEPATGEIFWNFAPIWKNGGVTPTRLLYLNVIAELRTTPLPNDFEFPEAPGERIPMLLGPGASARSRMVSAYGRDLAEMGTGTRFFYIWGSARYRDIFADTPERITRFCVEAIGFTGNPALHYNSETNIVLFDLPYYTRNNCMDDGCR